jgi:hypothetical protein
MALSRFLPDLNKVLLWLGSLLVIVACQGTNKPDYPIIFADQLGSSWEDWSWDCSCDMRSTVEAHTGRYAIAVTLSAWGGLGIGRHQAVDTTGYSELEFFIHGGESGGQRLRVSLEDQSGNELPFRGGVTLVNPLYMEGGEVRPSAWTRVTIPLLDLDATNALITKLNIMDNSGERVSTFYVDDIALVASSK